MNAYEREGYANRKEYLDALAEQFDLPAHVVYTAAGLLGQNEDFDGLISTLEDESMSGRWEDEE